MYYNKAKNGNSECVPKYMFMFQIKHILIGKCFLHLQEDNHDHYLYLQNIHKVLESICLNISDYQLIKMKN